VLRTRGKAHVLRTRGSTKEVWMLESARQCPGRRL